MLAVHPGLCVNLTHSLVALVLGVLEEAPERTDCYWCVCVREREREREREYAWTFLPRTME